MRLILFGSLSLLLWGCSDTVPNADSLAPDGMTELDLSTLDLSLELDFPALDEGSGEDLLTLDEGSPEDLPTLGEGLEEDLSILDEGLTEELPILDEALPELDQEQLGDFRRFDQGSDVEESPCLLIDGRCARYRFTGGVVQAQRVREVRSERFHFKMWLP